MAGTFNPEIALWNAMMAIYLYSQGTHPGDGTRD